MGGRGRKNYVRGHACAPPQQVSLRRKKQGSGVQIKAPGVRKGVGPRLGQVGGKWSPRAHVSVICQSLSPSGRNLQEHVSSLAVPLLAYTGPITLQSMPCIREKP